MNKYEQIIEKIQKFPDHSRCDYFTKQEWKTIENTLETIQVIEIILKLKNSNLEKEDE